MRRHGRVGSGAVELGMFLGLAFGLSWFCWGLLVIRPDGLPGIPPRVLLYAGTTGPLLASLLCLCRCSTVSQRSEFWCSIYEVERLRPHWLPVILLTFPVVTAVALFIDCLRNGDPMPLTVLRGSVDTVPLLLSMLGTALLSGPVQEEPGWRGYALERLLQICSPLRASIALGLVWACWHLPLYFIPGSGHERLDLAGPAIWLFVLDATIASVIMTRIYLCNRHSVFAAILFHAMLNLTRESVPLPLVTEGIRTVLFAGVALLVWRCSR